MGGTSYLKVPGYYEVPIRGPSAAFAVLYALITTICILQNTYKSWKPLWMLPCTFTIFTAGFVCREITAYYGDAPRSPYSAAQGLLYSAVCVLTASIYLTIFYLMWKFPQASPIPTTWFTPLFAMLISVTISLTAQGTSTFFNPQASDSVRASGLALLKASVVLQLFFTVAFLAILAAFHRRYSGSHNSGTSLKKEATTVIYSLYAVAALLVVRNIFRTVQIFASSKSWVWTEEAFFWVFDAVPLVVCAVVLNVWHAGRVLLAEGLQACNDE